MGLKVFFYVLGMGLKLETLFKTDADIFDIIAKGVTLTESDF